MQTTATRTDPIARYVVYTLIALALWAGVRQLERPADPTLAQGIIIIDATLTPALPTPAPALMLIAPTPIPAPEAMPVAAPAPLEDTPAYFPVEAPPAPQIGAGEVEAIQATIEAPAAMYDPTLHPDEAAAALEAARQDLPTAGAAPDSADEAASDAYQRRRLDSGAYRPRTR